MSCTRFFAVIFPLALIMSCNGKPTSKVENNKTIAQDMMNDPHSAARPAEASVKHLDWTAEVNFENRQIKAIARWDINTAKDADTLFLDTKGLTIEKITLGTDETPAEYQLLPEDKVLGAALAIKITPATKRVNIYYITGKDAAALQWLDPDQTAGKKYPFLFTQSQAILARSWIPVQDGPGFRFTYTAKVTVPKEFLAVMSASNPTEKNSTGVYNFSQDKPIPAYLMALAAGDIAFRSVGEKTGVYAEHVMLEKSAYEMADMEKMLDAAEKLYGPYAWGRYDVLVLPPSFPFGGMENPVLTFATPTIIAGDRSLVALVAHELAHSWSGNLVTNANWNDFWLNEGFTVYFERRIMESIEGPSYAEMLAYLGYDDVLNTISDFEAAGQNEDTHLKLKLDGRDPDDGMNDIAYEKGYLLLVTVEKAVGREKFDAFLKNYFKEFAFQSMTTEQFIAYFREKLIPEGSEADQQVKLNDWIYGPGIPAWFKPVTSSRFQAVEAEAEKFLEGTAPASLHTKNWSSHEWQYFLRYLMPKMTLSKMEALDAAFHLTESGNSEIAALWFETALQLNYEKAFPNLEKFLVEVGRRKFLKPLYEASQKNPATKELGRNIYKKARKNYHSVAVKTIDEITGYPY